MNRTFTFLLFSFLFIQVNAKAEPDMFGTGNGNDGPLTVSIANTVINSYARMTSTVTQGNTFINITTTTGFSVGDLVMIWQWGRTGASAAGLGQWEFARINSLTATRLNFGNRLYKSFLPGATQVIKVPEYSSVTVNAGASLVARSWDGSTGGILVFLCQGNIVNNGSINADGAGLRGGIYVRDASGTMGETGLNAPGPVGAAKGQGYVNNGSTILTGRGNDYNGGGGGVAYLSGGAGGGLVGKGGAGGYSAPSDGTRAVGGIGGAELDAYSFNHLLMGGGGGAGHGSATNGANGGNGGGVVYLRANGISGIGTIQASGNSGGVGGLDAAGGGAGGGGTVILRARGTISIGAAKVNARGGVGGNANATQVAPGGGGGGGQIYFEGCAGSTTISSSSVAGGMPGTQLDPGATGGSAFGADAGTTGILTTTSSCMPAPAAPVIVYPANNKTTRDRFIISGTAPAGATVLLFLDNVQLATVSADAGGNFSYDIPVPLANAVHNLKAFAGVLEIYNVSATISFTSNSAYLPVTWRTFTGQKKDNHVLLQWSTASEQNSAVFEVERSFDGKSYSVIGKVNAAGNTSLQQDYQFTDEQPAAGLNHYRLKQIDINGKHEYSKIVTVIIEATTSAEIRPNPVRDELRVKFSAPRGLLLLKIADISGRIVLQQQVMSTGSLQQTVMNMRSLKAGVYFLVIGEKKLRVVKQ
jgi:hypothetical protein